MDILESSGGSPRDMFQNVRNSGVASCGDTFEEAVSSLKEAVELFLENAKELGIMDDIEESLTTKEKYTAQLEVIVQ